MVDTTSPTSAPWALESTLRDLRGETSKTNDVLERYLKAMLTAEQLAEMQTKSDNMAHKDAADLSDDIAGGFDDLSSEFKQDSWRQKYASDSLSKLFSNSMEAIGSQLSSSNPSSIFNSMNSTIQGVKGSFEGLTGPTATMVNSFAMLSTVLTVAYARTDELNKAFIESYSQGVIFGDGLSGLNRAVGDSGLTITEFTGILNKHSQTFAVLGGDRAVKLGKSFKELTKSGSELMMTQSESQEAFMSYMDIQRSSGRLSRMTDAQLTNGANAYLKSINDLSEATGRSREELLRSTKDAIAQPEFQAFLATMNDGAKDSLQAGITSLAAFGSDVQNEFKNMIVANATGGQAAMFKNNQALMQLATQTGQLPQLMNILGLAKAGKDTTQEMLAFQKGLENSNLVQSGTLATQAQFGGIFAEMNTEFGKLTVSANDLANVQATTAAAAAAEGISVEEYNKRRKEQSEAALKANADMATAMSKLNSAFTDLMLNVVDPILIPALSMLATVVQQVVDGFNYVSDSLADFFGGGSGAKFAASSMIAGGGFAAYKGAKMGLNALRSARDLTPEVPGVGMPGGLERMGKGIGSIGEGVGKSISSITKGLSGAISSMAEALSNSVKSLTSGIGSIMTTLSEAIGKSITSISKGIGSALSNVSEGLGKSITSLSKGLGNAVGNLSAGLGTSISSLTNALGKSIGSLGEGIGKAIGGLGAGLGKGAGALFAGIMQGMAAGLKAMADPMILVGAAVLSGSIAIIGAGIAGAAWILGKSLPTLAEGLKAFDGLDGSNLEQVGLGMIGIGGGLLAIGAGDVASAVGSFVGWIGSLFGAEDPIDRLKRFGELAEPLGNAGPALSQFGKAFMSTTALLNAATLNDSVGTTMQQLMNMLGGDASGIFGGQPPIIGQLNSLAEAISNVAHETAALQNGATGATGAGGTTAPKLNPAELQKRTLAFYDDQRYSNATFIALLQAANEKLAKLDTTISDTGTTTVRAIQRQGNQYG